MTDERFEELVAEAFELIPQQFREAMRNVALVIEDEPSPELLAELGMAPPETLYGLYQGISLVEREWGQLAELPDQVIIFRDPILEDAEDEDDVVRAVGETVIHEFGHHFGLSEEEIDEAEAIWAEETFGDQR
ncbi:MAG: metallopeptidase family protein [Acidobacteriota bacterium]|nr:metallopeptidase family protein [Acidobacteriota bacterium]